MQRLVFNFITALDAVFTNQLRAFLTALGILFGVAAVIAMLAIGEGAQKELLDQMKLIGTNNIVVKAVVETGEDESDEGEQKRPFSPGLSLDDIKNLKATVPTIEEISPEIILPVSVIRNGKLKKAKCIGIENTFFELNNLEVELGSFFHHSHMESGAPVCVIGKNIQAQFFNNGNPIGKQIKCGNTWLKVIGVIGKRMASKQSLTALGIRDHNSDIYVPIQTALLRVKNRSLLTSKMFEKKGFVMFGSDDDSNKGQGPVNYHQLDRMVIRVKETALLQSTADVVARILNRRHWEVVDYEVSVPELLIKQQQRTQDLFNYVLGAIAGISLLVGGIGIMNIMLASVLERIKEIGLRRSLGATQSDVVQQFVFEAVFISLIGGLIGVMLGVFFAHLIAQLADIPTIVTTSSIVLSFGVSATIGLIFGIIPARRAAQLDPITALRND